MSKRRVRSLDDPIDRYLPELKGGGYRGVTIRQILQMRSGVDYEERYDFANPGAAARNHIAALARNVARFADAVRTVRRAHPPGQHFQYKTLDTAVLGWLVERVSGGSTVAAYTASRLWEPLGAEADGFYIMDGSPGIGREFSGAGFNATLRDFARFGQMMLNGGVADGRRIAPTAWVADSSRPIPAVGAGETAADAEARVQGIGDAVAGRGGGSHSRLIARYAAAAVGRSNQTCTWLAPVAVSCGE